MDDQQNQDLTRAIILLEHVKEDIDHIRADISKIKDAVYDPDEGIYAPLVLTILSAVLCYGLADKIYI